MALIDKAKAVADRTGYQQKAVLEILKAFTESVVEDLKEKGFYAHGGLGTFKVVRRPGKTLKSMFGKPVKGKKAVIPERNGVRFRVSSALRKAIQKVPI